MSFQNDYLYRVSIKALIKNPDGGVLVVKEAGRATWDLPGGGMNHNESIKIALARELKEEIGLIGEFEYRVIAVEDPRPISRADIWQIRIIFEVIPENYLLEAGSDSDEIMYVNPMLLKDSEHFSEQQVYKYSLF